MTPEERREFDEVQAEQRRLRGELEKLDLRFASLRKRIEASEGSASEMPPLQIPPVAAPAPSAREARAVQPPAAFVPPIETPAPAAAAAVAEAPLGLAAAKLPATPSASMAEALPPTIGRTIPLPPPPPPPPPLPQRAEGLEMQLGTVWLARIGIVILLTGLVFLGNYAWQNWVVHTGPAGKLAIIYLAGAGLCGLGAWMLRRQESLRMYAQVLIAGGGATIYYATYAAHFVERLRVIESPILGGALLLALGAGFLWWADRRKLQPAALLAIVLSYYTSAMNEAGSFTLFSSLVVTAAGVVLLIRHQWVAVSWASLAGTYASYCYWEWFRQHTGAVVLLEPAPLQQWAPVVGFLCAYWALFMVSVFYSRERFGAGGRVAFVSLNNAGLFFCAMEPLWHRVPEGPWIFTVSLGAALLGLAWAARKWRREYLDLDAALLVQGVGFFTAGLALKLAPEHLCFFLAAESLVLLCGSGRRHGLIFEILGGIAAGWAAGEGWHAMVHEPTRLVLIGGIVATFLIADAWLLKLRRGEWQRMQVTLRALWFSALALLLIGRVLVGTVPYAWDPTALALAAVICTASIYLLRLPEITLLGQFFLFVALVYWFDDLHAHVDLAPWWRPLPLALSALGLSHWWQAQRVLPINWNVSVWRPPDAEAKIRAGGELATLFQFVMAGALIAVSFATLRRHIHGDPWLLTLSGAALITLIYGYATRAWAIAAWGQAFAIAAVVYFLTSLGMGHPSWPFALAPVVMLLGTCALLSFAPAARWSERGAAETASPAAMLYWVAGWVVLSVWVAEYIPAEWRSFTFSALAAALLCAGLWRGAALLTFTGFALTAETFGAFFLNFESGPSWPELAAILLPSIALRATPRRGQSSSIPPLLQHVLSGLVVFAVWLWSTRYTNSHHYQAGLTVVWSVVALILLAAGFALRERAYRLGGLAVLALAIGRIFFVDVWALETIYRILSFLTLGVVLLALGYLYNRYAERIRKWL